MKLMLVFEGQACWTLEFLIFDTCCLSVTLVSKAGFFVTHR